MLYEDRNSIFHGGVINLNPCLPGRFGNFCELCDSGYYKSGLGNEECQKCPCETRTGIVGAKSIKDCQCWKQLPSRISIYTILAYTFGFFVLMIILYTIMRKKKKYEDKTFM